MRQELYWKQALAICLQERKFLENVERMPFFDFHGWLAKAVYSGFRVDDEL